MAIRVFGLTGGVASGKSSVAERFRYHGIEIIDADVLARQVVARGTHGLAEIVSVFGPDVLTDDGRLDRQRLATQVFADPRARRRLEAIVHPRIVQASAQRIRELARQGLQHACYEAALLVESGRARIFRPLVVVSLTPEVQRARLMQRDGITEAEAERRIASQAPLGEKLAVADHVIDNSGTMEDLRRRADEVLGAIRAD